MYNNKSKYALCNIILSIQKASDAHTQFLWDCEQHCSPSRLPMRQVDLCPHDLTITGALLAHQASRLRGCIPVLPSSVQPVETQIHPSPRSASPIAHAIQLPHMLSRLYSWPTAATAHVA